MEGNSVCRVIHDKSIELGAIIGAACGSAQHGRLFILNL